MPPGDLLRLPRLRGELVPHVGQPLDVHLRARGLHALQYAGCRQFDGMQQRELPAFVDARRQRVRQGADDGRVHDGAVFARLFLGLFRFAEVQLPLRGLLFLFEVQIQEMAGGLFQRLGMEVRVHQIAGQLGVEQRGPHGDSRRREHVQVLLEPVQDHGGVMLFDQLAHRLRNPGGHRRLDDRGLAAAKHDQRGQRHVARLGSSLHMQHPRTADIVADAAVRLGVCRGIRRRLGRRQIPPAPFEQLLGAFDQGDLGHIQSGGCRFVGQRGIPVQLRALPAVECLQDTVLGTHAELQAGEQRADLVDIQRAEGQVVHGDAQINVADQCVDLAVELDLFEVLAQRLALLAADLVGVFDDLVEPAELVDPFGGESVTHTRHAGDVVRGLAAQRGQIGVLRRRHVILLLDRLRCHVLEVLEVVAGVQHGDVLVDQLEGVTVAGKHQRAVSGALPHGGQGADDVVALVAGFLDVGDAQGLEHLLDQRQLAEQFLGRGLARPLVLRQQVVAERAALDVERHGEVVGPLRFNDLREHGDEAPDRVRRLSGGRAEVLDR